MNALCLLLCKFQAYEVMGKRNLWKKVLLRKVKEEEKGEFDFVLEEDEACCFWKRIGNREKKCKYYDIWG